jgi:ATP-dependent RNA helicase DeaD
MDLMDLSTLVGEPLAGALIRKGFSSLTSVQMAVLDPRLAGRDLRITSQTGSGKTVALGFVLRPLALKLAKSDDGVARPRVLIVAPTRELAKQVEEELAWLYAPLDVRVVSATGGASYRAERRALAQAPTVVVGTPGRLLDYLGRGAINASQLGALVLDEADRMLEMGFREELEAILAFAPHEHQTHLVAATFPRAVQNLADRVQRQAAHVQGTPLGEANADIDHVLHLVDPNQRVDALVNLLLAYPNEQTLIFCRTRVEVAEIASELDQAGFAVGPLSGDMEQAARDRALASFRRGQLRALVATDVAARGIDVQGIDRVIHVEAPPDPDSYTHRSGRTGRAGRKGISSVLVSPSAYGRTVSLLHRAGVSLRFEPLPTPDTIAATADQALVDELTADQPPVSAESDARTWALANRLVDAGNLARLVARLLTRCKYAGPSRARELRVVRPPSEQKRRSPDREGSARRSSPSSNNEWVMFRVSWGTVNGADTRRLLAVVCRRGGIAGSDVGSIRVGRTSSWVEVRSHVADAFGEAAQRPDSRNPRVKIWKEREPDVARPAPRSGPPPAGRMKPKKGKGQPHPPAPRKKSKRSGATRPSLDGNRPPRRRVKG